MKRFRVKITDKNGFYHEFDDGSAIGGSYGDPVTLTMCLNKPEHEALLLFMGQVSEKQHDVAVFNLSQCRVLSDWHRRMMRKYFKAFTKQVTIELL